MEFELGKTKTVKLSLTRCMVVHTSLLYKDCFAWNYHEIIGMEREFVEHKLPVTEGYKSYKHMSCRFNPHFMV